MLIFKPNLVVAFALFGALALVKPVHATPAQSVSVTDHALATNDGHLFILRTLEDNLGTHSMQQVDVILLAQALSTGQTVQVWPVHRVIDYGIDHTRMDEPFQVQTLPLPGSVNPFDILAQSRAVMVQEWQVKPLDGFRGSQIWVENETLLVGQDNTAASHAIEFSRIVVQIKDSLNIMRIAVPPHKAEGGVDILQDLELPIAEICSFSEALASYGPKPLGTPDIWFVKVTCERKDGLGHISIFVSVPPLG